MVDLHLQYLRSRPSRRLLPLCFCLAAVVSTIFIVRPISGQPQVVHDPLKRAYIFLDQMMDLYRQHAHLMLIQIYVQQTKHDLGDTAFIYENALAILAFLQRRTADDLARAKVLGNSLVYAQNHDPYYKDGRLRNSYHVNPCINTRGIVNMENGQKGSFTGNIAWVGLALAHLYSVTNNRSYLESALKSGMWIQSYTYDTRDSGGYTGGIAQDMSPLSWKSTEHNIDIYAFFTMLAQLSNEQISNKYAMHAIKFVYAMWDSSTDHFWTGTKSNGVDINTDILPADIQTWSYLALQNSTYSTSIDWTKANLSTIDVLGSLSMVV